MKITAPNTTQIPNVIFDYWMNVLAPAEFKVLMCIARKTFGWHKEKDAISRSQIVRMTGLGRDTVRKCIYALEERHLLTKHSSISELGDNDPNVYEINVTEEVHPGVGLKKAQGLAENKPTGGLKKSPTKERPTKENNTNIYAPSEDDANAPISSSSSKNKKVPYRSLQLQERLSSHPEAIKFNESFNMFLVGIDDENHQKLIEKYGEAGTLKLYEYLAEWKLSKAQVSPSDVKKHADIFRIRKWVVKEVFENQKSSPGAYKRTGKLAIESDKKAMEQLQEKGTSYIDAEDFAKQLLESDPSIKEAIEKRKRLEEKDKGNSQ